MKILIIEDHSIVRYGIVRILMTIAQDMVIDECDDFDEGLKRIGKQRYDLVILDINIPNGNNLQMIRLMRQKQSAIKILIFSGYDESVYALRYLKEGADGYLMKDSPNQEIIDAVRCVLNNEKYFSSNIRRKLLENLQSGKHAANDPLADLSDRELEVMQGLIQGQAVGEIARVMNLHVSTVSTYKARIFKKFEVNNILELAEKRKILGK